MNVSGMSTGAGIVMRLFNSIQRSAGITGSQIDRLGKSLALFAGGALITGGGVLGAKMIGGWMKDAGAMQDALVQVGMAAKGTNAELAALYSQSFKVAGQTQFSAPTVLSMEQEMARLGFRDLSGKTSQRAVIGQAIPEFARAAEIDSHFMGASPQSVVAALAQQAHMFGQYSGAALARNVAYATGAGLNSGMSPQQQANTLRYLVPAQRGLGMSSLDAFSLAALGNQTGLTMGRGGSNIAAMLRYMLPCGSASHKQGMNEIQTLGGGQFFNKQGNFQGVANALQIINRFEKVAPNAVVRMTALVDAFKVQGAQAASVLGSDSALKQFLATRSSIATYTPSKLQDMQAKLNETLVGSMTTLRTNFQSISALLGAQLLPILVPVVRALVAFTSGLLDFMRIHPQLTRLVAVFALVATTVALVVGPFLILVGILGAISVGFEVLGAGLGAIATIGLAPFLLIILAVGAALVGVTLFIMNFGKIMHEAGAGIHNLMVMLGLVHAPAVPTRPLGGAPPASQVQGLQLRHNHYELAKGNEWYYQDTRTNKWIPDGKYIPGKGTGGGGYVAPGAVVFHPGSIVVNGAAHHDEHAIAEHTAALVFQKAGDELLHTLTSGAPSVFGLSPALNTPAPR